MIALSGSASPARRAAETDGDVGLRQKIFEEIEQCQSGNTYVIFEHIDVMLLVEGELFVDSLEEGYDIAVVIQHEKVAHRLHSIIAPRHLTQSVVLVGYAFVLESTVECFLWRLSAIFKLLQVVHVFVREMTFLRFTTVYFQVLFIAILRR